MSAELFPIFLKLEGQPVLLVGGGAVAHEKLVKLVAAGAVTRVVSPHFSDDVVALANAHPELVELIPRPADVSDLYSVRLALSAADDGELNRRLAAAARVLGLWFNAADVADQCEFYMAGSVTRGPLTLAVSSHGLFPGLVRAARRLLEAAIPEGHESALEALTAARARLKTQLPDPATRLTALRAIGSALDDTYFANRGRS